MTYNEAIEFLYNSLPVFHNIGAGAYKPGLATSMALDDIFGNPHHRYPTIHIAGTNGKGSTAHTLAAILQRSGYRTGLYTSPHIFDFRERIRVNGHKISTEAVVDFVERWKKINTTHQLTPSFFELTSTMAFEYFANSKVDVAIIETGLGGRLDSTNIISPILSIITNISLDHTALLGDTLPQIAAEKAGIIKDGTPVVIGELHPETAPVFDKKAAESMASITYAAPVEGKHSGNGILYPDTPFGEIYGELAGDYQINNTATEITAVTELRKLGLNISDSAVREGFANVISDTHLQGRWMKIASAPLTICDTGHNCGGWEYIVKQLDDFSTGAVHLITGFVNDKDISTILHLISSIKTPLQLYFSSPSVARGLKAEELAAKAAKAGLQGKVIDDVNAALAEASSVAHPDNDMILIAGSNFLMADLKIEGQ